MEGKGKNGGNKTEKGPDERGSEVASQRKLPLSVTTVYLGGIPAGLRVSELKTALREREAAPLRLTWQGAQHRAFLDYSDPQAAEQALEALQGLSLNGHSLQAELAKSQRGGKKSGQLNRKPRASAALKPKTATGDTKVAPASLCLRGSRVCDTVVWSADLSVEASHDAGLDVLVGDLLVVVVGAAAREAVGAGAHAEAELE
ncbi:hypothetical protein INR49_012334 [Caranx melampygus]|nr:hypothetical protein INR49_012334 [Caranx melampygus]